MKESSRRSSHASRLRRCRLAVATISGLAGCTATTRPISGPIPSGAEAIVPVVVSGVQVGGGPVRIAVYREPASFMTREGMAIGRSVPSDGERVGTIFILPVDAEVAIMVFQDSDSDETLDRGFLGLPREPWGATGTPSALARPSWDACAFRIRPDAPPIEIALFGSRAERRKN